MSTISLSKHIDAPPETVFSTVANIEEFSTAIPHIVSIDFLTEQKTGVGTRFREIRSINGREASAEFEVKEYVENERVRLVTDSYGVSWDTLFTMQPNDGGTRLNMVMEARPHNFMTKLTLPLMQGMIKKEIEKDLDIVKVYCEGLDIS